MKKIIFSIIAIFIACNQAFAANDSIAVAMSGNNAEAPARLSAATQAAPGELALKADSAYSADNFALAEQLYLQAIERDGSSSDIYYNLGNTYYRLGNPGKAIVNYERALKLNPTNSDARTNLEFLHTKITDRQIDDGSIMTVLWNNIVCMFKANTWAWISFTLFIVFLAAALSYLFAKSIMIKKTSFFGGLVTLMFCIISVIISVSAANRITNCNNAIILTPSAQLSTTPRSARTAAEEAFLLHEGTKVEIVDSVQTPNEGLWYEVKVGAKERAWIKACETERI